MGSLGELGRHPPCNAQSWSFTSRASQLGENCVDQLTPASQQMGPCNGHVTWHMIGLHTCTRMVLWLCMVMYDVYLLNFRKIGNMQWYTRYIISILVVNHSLLCVPSLATREDLQVGTGSGALRASWVGRPKLPGWSSAADGKGKNTSTTLAIPLSYGFSFILPSFDWALGRWPSISAGYPQDGCF